MRLERKTIAVLVSVVGGFDDVGSILAWRYVVILGMKEPRRTISHCVFNLILFAWVPLRPLFPRRISVFSLCLASCNFVKHTLVSLMTLPIAPGLDSCVLFGTQYKCIPCSMDCNSPTISVSLSTYASFTLLHQSILFHRASGYSVGARLGDCVARIMSSSVSEITSSVY